MFGFDELKSLCQQDVEGKAYYRPFVRVQSDAPVQIFIVGTNPATPITPKDMDLDRYTRLIMDSDAFVDHYMNLRKHRGQTPLSRTRMGMNGLTRRLRSMTDAGIIETNVTCYPTRKAKELFHEPVSVIERGKDIFVKVLLEYRPRVIIAHGKESHQALSKLVETSNELDWKDAEGVVAANPVDFSYARGGETATIIPVDHLMYHGHNGEGRFGKMYETLPRYFD